MGLKEERVRLRGILAEKKIALKDLKIKADGLVISLRMNLDPYKDIAELPAEIIASQANELANTILMAKELAREIKKMEDELGS